MTPAGTGLVVQGVARAFGPTLALRQANLHARPGEIHALLGENGSGKSTLLRILHGDLRPDAGTVHLDGQPYAPSSPREALRAGVALVHQELALCPDLTVAENIWLGDEPRRGGRLDRRRMDEGARDALAPFGELGLTPTTLVRHLPPARRQLVEVARALRAQARVILFDEPTSSLGATEAEHLFTILEGLRNEGRVVVYITHFLDEVRRLADRVTVLRDGEAVANLEGRGHSAETLASLMAGRPVSEVYHRSPRTPGEVAVSLRQVAGRTRPHHVDLDVRFGEVVGLAGLDGAGRTETLRLLQGLDPIRSGQLTVLGVPGSQSPCARWRQGVGLVSEDRKGEGLALTMTVAENVALPSLGHAPRGRRGWAQRGTAAIQRLGIRAEGPAQPVGSLSGGNQQKVALARLLDPACRVWLLDEPTRGIDVNSKAEIYRLIDGAATDGAAVIIAGSYLPELLGLCDRLVVFRRGEVVANLDARTTSEAEVLRWSASA